MHTATRLALSVRPLVRKWNPTAHLCFYGLYAPMNQEYLRTLGAGTILGGEFEEGLVAAVERVETLRRNAARLAPGQHSRSNTSFAPRFDYGADVATCRMNTQTEPVISLARQEFIVPY